MSGSKKGRPDSGSEPAFDLPKRPKNIDSGSNQSEFRPSSRGDPLNDLFDAIQKARETENVGSSSQSKGQSKPKASDVEVTDPSLTHLVPPDVVEAAGFLTPKRILTFGATIAIVGFAAGALIGSGIFKSTPTIPDPGSSEESDSAKNSETPQPQASPDRSASNSSASSRRASPNLPPSLRQNVTPPRPPARPSEGLRNREPPPSREMIEDGDFTRPAEDPSQHHEPPPPPPSRESPHSEPEADSPPAEAPPPPAEETNPYENDSEQPADEPPPPDYE